MDDTKTKLIEILSNRWGYQEHSAEESAKKILEMDPEIAIEFQKYLETGKYSTVYNIFGLTPADIAEVYPFKPPAVYLYLDWVKREPDIALNALIDEYHRPLPDSFNPEAYNKYKQEIKEE